jgi:hypothetical protein
MLHKTCSEEMGKTDTITDRKRGSGSSVCVFVSEHPFRMCKYIVKGKAVPLQAWSGPDGSRKLRFPDFMKTAQDGGKVVNLTHRPPVPTGNTPGTHFC